jgi:hypothetical protein
VQKRVFLAARAVHHDLPCYWFQLRATSWNGLRTSIADRSTNPENKMSQAMAQPQITENGIAFTVRVDSVNRDCVISLEALSKLSQLRSGISDPMETFHAFEASILGTARRMVGANVQGTPLQLGPNSFH